MFQKNRFLMGTASAIALFLLILDGRTALQGGREGVTLCLRTVVPALLPFFILSNIINRAYLGTAIPCLRPLGRLCGIPKGCESLLILGFIGGYPVGAQNVIDANGCKSFSASTAKRLLGFCSNAGPAFIFGIAGNLFSKPWVAWVLWGIHIFSALTVGCLLPGKDNTSCRSLEGGSVSIAAALQNSIRAIAVVCTWVILFRVILSFAERWFLWLLPQWVQICIMGAVELTNGICGLSNIANEGFRFVSSAGMLGFGGLCVFMQTVSITKSTGRGYYFPGKVLHCCMSVILAYILEIFLFPRDEQCELSWLFLILLSAISAFTLLIMHKKKKSSRKIAISYV